MSSIVEDWECTECKDGKGFQEHFNDSEEGHIFECLKCKYMEVYREDVDTGKIVEDYVGYEHEYNNQQANKQRGHKMNLLKHVKPNKDCTQGCDNITDNNYVCFECEEIQVREKYPNAIYNSDCQWELKQKIKK